MTDFEFSPWPKTTRLFRDIVITEKIDGTNSAILFDDGGNWATQSRKRLITPEDDNYGFARWVSDSHVELFELLGPGSHFGELWGKKIQGGYGQDCRRFSLFNTLKWRDRFEDNPVDIGGVLVDVVPTLYQGPFSEEAIRNILLTLKEFGSVAAPGQGAEGVCVYHTQSRVVQKVTLDGEDRGKWERAV